MDLIAMFAERVLLVTKTTNAVSISRGKCLRFENIFFCVQRVLSFVFENIRCHLLRALQLFSKLYNPLFILLFSFFCFFHNVDITIIVVAF